MPATGGPQGHTGGHQRQRRTADRRHGGRAVGSQHVGDDTQGVGEVLDGRHDRQQRPLGQEAVPDLAALRTAHEAGLTGGEGREVVVVHVALVVDRGDGVELLLHAGHAQCRDVEHLGLAALEERRAVRRREQVDLGRERADVGDATAVHAHAFLDDALAHQLLGQRADGPLDLPGRSANSSPRAARISSPAASSAALRSALLRTRLALAMGSVPTASTRAQTSSW